MDEIRKKKDFIKGLKIDRESAGVVIEEIDKEIIKTENEIKSLEKELK